MSRNDITLYTWLAVIVLAGVIICVIILKKQKEQRERQERQQAAKAKREAEKPASRPAAAPARPSEPVKKNLSADEIDLKQALNSEDLRLLATDLGCIAMKVHEPEQIMTVNIVKSMVEGTGIIPKQALDLCIAATQDSIDGVASTFGISMGGHNALLEKLKKLKE